MIAGGKRAGMEGSMAWGSGAVASQDSNAISVGRQIRTKLTQGDWGFGWNLAGCWEGATGDGQGEGSFLGPCEDSNVSDVEPISAVTG